MVVLPFWTVSIYKLNFLAFNDQGVEGGGKNPQFLSGCSFSIFSLKGPPFGFQKLYGINAVRQLRKKNKSVLKKRKPWLTIFAPIYFINLMRHPNVHGRVFLMYVDVGPCKSSLYLILLLHCNSDDFFRLWFNWETLTSSATSKNISIDYSIDIFYTIPTITFFRIKK